MAFPLAVAFPPFPGPFPFPLVGAALGSPASMVGAAVGGSPALMVGAAVGSSALMAIVKQNQHNI